MSEPGRQTLGAVFGALPFPEDERARIAALAASKSVAARIIQRHLPHTPEYKNTFIKRERFAGALPGSELYNKQAIPRIVRGLGSPTERQYKFYWQLYRSAVIGFMHAEMRALNTLLSQVQAPETADTGELIKAVCLNAQDYGVSADDIKTFYELWGIPRLPDFEARLPDWLRGDPVSRQARQLDRLTANVAALKTQLDALIADVAAHRQTVDDQHKQDDARARDRERLASALEVLAGRVAAVEQDLRADANDRSIDERLQGLAERIESIEARLTVPRDEVSTKDLHKLASATKQDISASVQAATDAVTAQVKADLSALTTQLEARLANPTRSAREREPPAQNDRPYRSPLIGAMSRAHAPYRLKSELDFVAAWRNVLQRQHDVTSTNEQTLACHRALLASRVAVMQGPIALSWVECLGWEPFTVHVAASPIWSSEEDWALAASHVFGHVSATEARIAVIHSYDLGLIDCYLAPSLLLWSLRRQSSALAKLFLIPSEPDHVPSASVLEHAVFFDDRDLVAAWGLRLRDDVRLPQSFARDPRTGVDPKDAAEWASSSKTTIDLDLEPLQQALQRRFPVALVDSVHRIALLLAEYLDRESAIAVAMHQQLLPWVQCRYGEAKATELGSLLSTMDGHD